MEMNLISISLTTDLIGRITIFGILILKKKAVGMRAISLSEPVVTRCVPH